MRGDTISSGNWIIDNLNSSLETWNDKLSEIWTLLTTSPENFKGGGIWNVIVGINDALKAIAYALLVLFFVIGVMKTCGSFTELKRPEVAFKCFIRFVLAQAAVTYGMELMTALFSIAQGAIQTIMGASGLSAMEASTLPAEIATTIEEGFSLPKVEKFEELINERTKAILICNPNNPTGYLYTRREMNQIRDLVKKYDLFLFSDEVYREFIYTGSPYISACHLEGIENNVVLIDSVSKRYSECGIRIGALITKNKEIRDAVMKFCQARLSPPLIGQIAAEASLDAPEEYSRETYDEYVERRKCLIDGLNRIPGVYSPIPMGAFYTVAKLPVDDSDKFCAWCLSDFEYEGQTVFMAPASGFYTTPGSGINEVRIAYVLKKEDLTRALFILQKALEAYPGRTE